MKAGLGWGEALAAREPTLPYAPRVGRSWGLIPPPPGRVLKVFLSRSAQRVPCVSSQRVLKMLGLILLLVLWFLAAWTIGMLENLDKNIPLVVRAQTARGLHFYICSHDHWDYMMVIGETSSWGRPGVGVHTAPRPPSHQCSL